MHRPDIGHGHERVIGAVALGRALLSLERGQQSGVFEVSAVGTRARIGVVKGAIVAVGPQKGDETLGDALMQMGALDMAAHRSALESGAPATPVGGWLVKNGVAPPQAVAWALRAQFLRRLVELFNRPAPSVRFTPGPADIDVAPLGVSIVASDVVIRGLRSAFAEMPVEEALRPVGAGPLSLTGLGARAMQGTPLWPDEAAMTTLLRRGTSLAAIRTAVGGRRRPLRLLGALHALSAVQGRSARTSSYSLLVRKRRQLRSSAGPHALLDLPLSAPSTQARPALRKLASQLHPDCFGPDAPRAVVSLSSEVMAALVQAEAQLR